MNLDQVGSFNVADKVFKDINDFVKEKIKDQREVFEDACENGTRVSWFDLRIQFQSMRNIFKVKSIP